jgi:arabinogalactan endo-1,4-beta-galactosidase
VLTALLQAGVVPAWVQIGNETNDGMLWEEGRASKNMGQFAAMIAAGAKAVRETSASSKVIVHISNGYDNALFRWIFDGLTASKVDYDIIAMSLYPSVSNWSSLNMQCLNNMNDMVARYNKEIMISEVGMEMAAATACKSFIQDLIAKTKSVNQKKGLGVFYWEPQSYNSWKGYKLGAFDDTGKPTAAMDAFMN